jgi:aspartate-semialdehyde dehydrogenase
MSTEKKPAATPSRMEPSRGATLYRVAIVGAASLKGKEVAEVLEDRKFPALDTKLLDDDESLGQLEAVGEEMNFIQAVKPDQFEHIDFTFFASEETFTRAHWNLARDTGSSIVDLSFALENEAGARVRSPWIERQLGQHLQLELQPGPAVTAHSAAVALALLLLRAQKAGEMKRVAATVFEPASERGQRGMDELHGQTVNLLNFHEVPKKVFDTQIAFNMVNRFGEHATLSLEGIERRVLRHFEIIAGKEAVTPALLLVQAPIFHGYAFSIYVETREPVALGDLSQALAGEHVSVIRQSEDWPSNVRASGQNDIQVSLQRDANHENGYWMWAAADNLRIAAANAVECAESMAASRPRGTVQ